jgi:peptide/nickel transport system ATP-binding protein
MSTPLLQIENVTRDYMLPREHLWHKPGVVHALQGVNLMLNPGTSLGVVGESGSGKSTLARLAMALEMPSSGTVRVLGQDMAKLDAVALRAARRNFQMVFQDPYGSLDPRQKIAAIVAEPLYALQETSTEAMRQQASEVLQSVGLRASDLDKYPHEFSGGQRQRIAIARALITRPKLIVADEPVSALDVSVQAQVLNLMQDLQQQFGVTYLLISHDLAVVDHLCDEVAVIFQGRIVEQGSPDTLFHRAAHPYTQALLEAVPRMQPGASHAQRTRSPVASGRIHPATACPYAHRCQRATDRCDASRPELKEVANGHWAACHFAGAA